MEQVFYASLQEIIFHIAGMISPILCSVTAKTVFAGGKQEMTGGFDKLEFGGIEMSKTSFR
jgi:hypothetical protein